MDIGKIVDIMLGREPKYESVDADYLGNGEFNLSAERGSRKVDYNSQDQYSIIVESPLLNLISKRLSGPTELERNAPSMMVEDSEKKETAYIIYDKKHNTVVLSIEKDGEKLLEITKVGHQILCSDPSMSDKTASKIASTYRKLFKQQQRMLGVKSHQRKALETTVEAYSIQS